MDDFLICMFDLRLVGKGLLRGQPSELPDLGFPYDHIHYEPGKETSFKILGDEQSSLTPEECGKVQAYIDAYRFKVWPINADGLCDGEAYIDEVSGQYAHCPPPNISGHHWYNPASMQWDFIHGVDASGEYIGNVPFIDCASIADRAPMFKYERWSIPLQSWIDARSLEQIKSDRKNDMMSVWRMAKSSGVLFHGHVWEVSDELIMAPDECTEWPDMFGEKISFSGFTMADLKASATAYLAECSARYADVVIKIDAAQTIDEVRGVDF